jgi:ATP-binding cassette, subfamily C, bacterial CydC
MHDLIREFRPFFRLLAPYRRRMLLGTGIGLTAIASSVGLLALAGWFLSATAIAGLSVTSAGMFNFFFPSIGVRIFAFVRTAARYFERLVTHDTTLRILAGLRVWFYRKLEPLVPASLSKYRSGDILGRLVEDIDTLDNLYLRVLSPTLVALAVSLMLFLFLACFDTAISIAGVLFLLIAGFTVPFAAGAHGNKIGRQLTRCSTRLRIRIVDGIQAINELLVFDAARRHAEAVRKEIQALTRCQRSMSRISAYSGAGITLLSGVALTTILYIGAERVTSGKLQGAALALVSLAVLAAFEAVQPLPRAYLFFGRSREAADRVREIIEAPSDIHFPKRSVALPQDLDVAFENVSFRYPVHGPWVFRDLNVSIPAGQRVAVVGETGSGKSTLMNLLVRFWDPSRGRVKIGGGDIRLMSETDLRGHVNTVSQRAHMFGTTIRENLLIARPDADENQLRKALKSACLESFVDALPEGMDTWVGESGKLLSGGEARRLALARCFLKDGPIWILDEPTEGLDQSIEKQLLMSIFEKTRGKTLILITHRRVELERMDTIIVLKAGRVHAQGPYEKLNY